MKTILISVLKMLLPELVGVAVRWIRKRSFMKSIWPVAHDLVNRASILTELGSGTAKRKYVAEMLGDYVANYLPHLSHFATARNINWIVETVLQEITEIEENP